MLRSCFLILSCTLFLGSCSYKMGHGSLTDKYKTVTIPYAEGDRSGQLTAEIIKQVSHAGALEYRTTNADLEVIVTLLDDHQDNIGYQFDRNSANEIIDRIVPTEGRIQVLAEVLLRESSSRKVILGPKELTVSVDYDFDPDITTDNVTSFSLGQLTATDAAKDVAELSVHEVLAGKIVDYILNSWE